MNIRILIKEQLKEMQSEKVIMTLWVKWKKPVRLAMTLAFEDFNGAQDISNNTGDNYIRVDM